MSQINSIKRHFDEASKEYDEHKYFNVKSAFSVRQRLILQEIEKTANNKSNILDCGCGTGELIIEIAKKKYNIDGFDISSGMVMITKSKLQKNNIKNINIWKDNICTFKTTKKYDIIIAAGVFQYLNKQQQKEAYQQINKVLKQNGLLITSYGNALFSLFTFNKYTIDFFKENIFSLHNWSEPKLLSNYVSTLISHSTEGRKKGNKSETAHDYLCLYMTNPFLIQQELKLYGFEYLYKKFFHFHALPPLIKELLCNPKEYDIKSSSMEQKYDESWFGYFMAYQFLVFSKKVY